jgi:hypothetical protein
MPRKDVELIRLKTLALAARQRLERLQDTSLDSEALRHAKDIWLEAYKAAATYEDGHEPGRLQRRN